MNSSTTPILAALVIQLALGFVVFQANRHRKANQCFLLLSLVAAAWLCCLYFTLTAMAADPDDEARQQFEAWIASLPERLQNSPELRERGESIKREVLASEGLR